MHKITDLNIYYLKLLNLIESDIDNMLSEVDMVKRSPKIIIDYLKMAKQCQEELENTDNIETSDWDMLTESTKAQILKLIEADVNARK